MTLSDDYEKGFADGLQWVANVLRHSATVVEQVKYDDFKSANGKSVHAISRVGQVHFANQLREVARTIESAIREPAP